MLCFQCCDDVNPIIQRQQQRLYLRSRDLHTNHSCNAKIYIFMIRQCVPSTNTCLSIRSQSARRYIAHLIARKGSPPSSRSTKQLYPLHPITPDRLHCPVTTFNSHTPRWPEMALSQLSLGSPSREILLCIRATQDTSVGRSVGRRRSGAHQ